MCQDIQNQSLTRSKLRMHPITEIWVKEFLKKILIMDIENIKRNHKYMRLTDNFSMYEFECKCGCKMPKAVEINIIELADNLQYLRDYLNVPIHLTNAYRCPIHNKKVGGVKNSQHLVGKAADLQIDNVSPESLADEIRFLMENNCFKKGGIGVYNTFTHVDIRGYLAKWNKSNKK
jgi:hypothetical protein